MQKAREPRTPDGHEASMCMESGSSDDDCCAAANHGSCSSGYTFVQGADCYKGVAFSTICVPPNTRTVAFATTEAENGNPLLLPVNPLLLSVNPLLLSVKPLLLRAQATDGIAELLKAEDKNGNPSLNRAHATEGVAKPFRSSVHQSDTKPGMIRSSVHQSDTNPGMIRLENVCILRNKGRLRVDAYNVLDARHPGELGRNRTSFYMPRTGEEGQLNNLSSHAHGEVPITYNSTPPVHPSWFLPGRFLLHR
jgi:hypothetical protein